MIAVLLVKNSAVNPENRTANMHIDARDIGDMELEQSLIDRGFILMTEAEWETHLATFRSEYQAWESSNEQERVQAEQAKQAEVEGYYVSLKTLRVKLDGEEKISESDLRAVLMHLIDILMAKEKTNL